MDEPHFHIEGVPPFDGDWPFDPSYFTNKEYRTIKQLSGVRSAEMWAAFSAGDTDLLVAWAVIALQRAGKFMPPTAVEVLWNANPETIQLILPDEAEADVDPPASAPPSETADERSGGAKSESSGSGSSPAGDQQDKTQNGTGHPSSELTSDSVLPISAP